MVYDVDLLSLEHLWRMVPVSVSYFNDIVTFTEIATLCYVHQESLRGHDRFPSSLASTHKVSVHLIYTK